MRPELSRLEQTALRDFAAALRARFGDRIEKLALFGSRARGEGRDDSDLDIAVVVHDLKKEERRAVQDLGWDVGYAHHLVLSPLVLDADAFVLELPIAREITRDGVAL